MTRRNGRQMSRKRVAYARFRGPYSVLRICCLLPRTAKHGRMKSRRTVWTLVATVPEISRSEERARGGLSQPTT